jgi:nitrous oxide reductase accessory protein NosL
MSRTHIFVFALFLVFGGLFGSTVQAEDDIHNHRQCAECGMDRKAYGFSRMLLVYAEGKEVGVCSLHCAVEAMDRRKDQPVKVLLVADRNTHAMIPAEEAIWVMGGKKLGVMTRQAKWAFQEKSAAESFIKEYGGEIVTWDEALAAARAD